METSIEGTDWMQYFCKSGELLFYYNKVTAEHRWPDTFNGYEHATPIYGRPLFSVGTQTDDYGCNNGCTSVHVDGALMQTNGEKDESSQLGTCEEMQQAPEDGCSNGCTILVDGALMQPNGEKDDKSQLEICEEMLQAPVERVDVHIHVDGHMMPPNTVEKEDSSAETSCPEMCEVVLPTIRQSDDTVLNGESTFQYEAEVTEDQNVGDHTLSDAIDGCLNDKAELSLNSNELFPGPKIEKKCESPVTDAKTKYECKTCEKAFLRKATLKLHQSIHIGVKPFVCKTCGRAFRWKSNHKNHEHTHSVNEQDDTKKHQCKTCGKVLSCKGNLKLHESLHTGVKPFVCETCSKAFRHKGTLKDHQFIHTGIKPFICKTCGKAFRFRASLKRHESIHNGVKPFVCKTCGKEFRLKCLLKNHENTHTAI